VKKGAFFVIIVTFALTRRSRVIVNRFEQFYRQYSAALFSYLMRMTGEYALACDLMQEAFTRYLSRYGPDASNRPLLYKIARNLFFDHRRRARGRSEINEALLETEIDPEKSLLMKDSWQKVLGAMEQLSEDDREILLLVASGELSYREIGTVLGFTETNVKVRVHRARLRLKEQLGG